MNACPRHGMTISLAQNLPALPIVYWEAVLTSATATYDAELRK